MIFSQIEVGTQDWPSGGNSVSFRDIANHDGESILVTGSIGRYGADVGFNFSNNVLSIDGDNQTHNGLTFVGILSENGDWQHVVDTGAISYGYNIETALKVESDTISSIYFLTPVNGTQVNVMYFDASLNLQTTYRFPMFYHTWTDSLDFMVLDHETSFLSGVLMGDVDRDNDGYNEGVSGFILFPLNSNDWDGDGITDSLDQCPNTSADDLSSVDEVGCAWAQLDQDGDLIPNGMDTQPDNPLIGIVNGGVRFNLDTLSSYYQVQNHNGGTPGVVLDSGSNDYCNYTPDMHVYKNIATGQIALQCQIIFTGPINETGYYLTYDENDWIQLTENIDPITYGYWANEGNFVPAATQGPHTTGCSNF